MDEIKQQAIIERLDSLSGKVQSVDALNDIKTLRAQLMDNACKDADMNGNGPATQKVAGACVICPVDKD